MITLHRKSDGAFLTSIRATADRSWVINNKSKCTLYMSSRDEKAIKQFMGVRNYIRIGHPTLPAWGGVIETDQSWSADGGITFTAWSAESLLISRTPVVKKPLKASSPGALFEQLIALANKPQDLLIRAGSIHAGGGIAEETLDGTNLLEIIRSIAQRWDMEFEFVPTLDKNGRLYFVANWYERVGKRSSLDLTEGQNVRRTNNPLKVTRRVINELTGFGEGSTDDTRPSYTARNAKSVEMYGLMQGVEDFDGVTQMATLKKNVEARLKVLCAPKTVIKVFALDEGDTFGNLRLGNTHFFRSRSFGFKKMNGIGYETIVRIYGMRYIEKINEVELINEETETEFAES